MKRRGVIDTGPLVAFVNRADHFHGWAVAALTKFDDPLETCDAVIVEAWHLLGRARGGREGLLGLVSAGHLMVSFGLAGEMAAVIKLMKKYADQPMSVADGCLVRMAELDARATLITLDQDFGVYRRGRAALRLAAPFSP